jgi:hypothetical protein
MRKNLSPMDRDVRLAIIAPLGFVLAVAAGLTTAGGILMFTGVVMTLISAFTGYSPFYELFGIDHAPPASTE